MRIALTGNPNSGKTTMYNALTGRSEKVGNWAGVTVDKKEHPIKKAYAGGEQLIAVDLPGAYSMSPFTSEESITNSYVKSEHPDVIINIVDATNLSRSLFFTTQLLELGIPVVVALNKSDINKKKETKIDSDALSSKLGCPVVNTISTSSDGLKAVVEAAIHAAGTMQKAPYVQGDIDLTDKAVAEAAVTGFIAKECVVSTLATVFMFEHLVDMDALEATGAITSANMGGISVVAGLAFLMFNLFTPPCFAALGAMNSEIKSKKWFWAGVGLQFAVGYVIAFLVFFFGTLFTGGSLGAVWMPILGWAITIAIAAIFTVMIIRKNKQLKAEYALKA